MQVRDKYLRQNIFSNGEKVLYRCAEGYTQYRGIRSIMCEAGKWTKLSMKCEMGGEPQVLPAEVTCPDPSIANGVKLSEAVSVYRVRDSVTFTCSKGFLLTGAQQLTCGPDGQWQPQLPLCQASNDITQSSKPDGRCGVPRYLPNAHLSDRYITQTDFGPGERVSYSCALGYMRKRGTYYSTCVSGKWTPVTLRCERKSCGSAGEISYGNFVYTGVEFGDTATGVCNEGYQLVGRDCAELPEVVNGETNGYLEPPYFYSTVIGYRCRVGTLIGAREIYCTKNGTWSDPPPKCK
ncbi:unnamed protein product, partial [Coregonus sp. 'balchen']